MPAAVRHAFQVAVTDGLHGVLWGGVALAFLTFLTTWLVREIPLRSGAAPKPDDDADVPVEGAVGHLG